MAATFSVDQNPSRRSFNGHIARHTRLTSGTMTFDNSYATGGLAIVPGDVGLKYQIDRIMFESEDGYIFKFDKAGAKVLAYYFDYDAVADGAAIEVAAAVDLSSVVVGYIAIGQ